MVELAVQQLERKSGQIASYLTLSPRQIDAFGQYGLIVPGYTADMNAVPLHAIQSPGAFDYSSFIKSLPREEQMVKLQFVDLAFQIDLGFSPEQALKTEIEEYKKQYLKAMTEQGYQDKTIMITKDVTDMLRSPQQMVHRERISLQFHQQMINLASGLGANVVFPYHTKSPFFPESMVIFPPSNATMKKEVIYKPANFSRQDIGLIGYRPRESVAA